MNLENPKEIVKKIKESGFPLEIESFNKLSSAEFYAESSNYIDEDSGKSRELDLESVISYGFNKDLGKGGFFMTHLIIQCKSLSKAWVFFDNTQKQKVSPETELFRTCNCASPLFGNFLKILEGKKRLNDLFENIQGKSKLHKSCLGVPTTDNDELYEAVITTIKAKKYFKKLYSKEEYLGDDLIRMFLPVIITDKIALWSVSLREKRAKEINFKDLKKEKFILLLFDYLGRNREWERNTVFITSIEYLDEFIKKVKNLSSFLYKEWNFFKKRNVQT